MQQVGTKYYVYNVVERKMYDVKYGPVFRLLLVQISAALPSACYISVLMLTPA
jgi:hypothetical protein